MKRTLRALCTALALFTFTLSAFAQGSAFTYQGRLNDGPNRAHGIYDLRFTIYDAVSGGNLIGASVTSLGTDVSNGVFAVTLDFGASVFIGAARWLEIAVCTNGANNFIPLNPRQPVTPTPYAITAGNVSGNVAASQITGTLPPSTVGPGTITSNALAPGAAAANLAASGQAGVGSGGVILSQTESNAALASAGYVKIATTTTLDDWQQRTFEASPSARHDHTAVWTGSEMIVWGGNDGGGYVTDGGRYNPAANSWTKIPSLGASAARFNHTAVWTGTEMIIWGGQNESSSRGDGARYNPVNNTWTSVSTVGAPSPRSLHTAVWVGKEMIVWGGQDTSGAFFNDGARYNPGPNTWSPVEASSAPTPRSGHTAVWTGREMIVWGGFNSDGYMRGATASAGHA